MANSKKKKDNTVPIAEAALRRPFRKPLHELVTSSRTFPLSARVDVQIALEKLFAQDPVANLLGVHTQYRHETLTVSHLSLFSGGSLNSKLLGASEADRRMIQ